MRRNALIILKTIIVSAIPACLSYLANSTLVFEKLINLHILSENANIARIQDYCLWIGIVLSAFFLSLNLIVTQIKLEQLQEERDCLIKLSKSILASLLEGKYLPNHADFNIRIFVPKHPYLYAFLSYFHILKMPIKFIIKNIALISDEGVTKGLQFEVSPNPQGLVGMCYNEKKVVYDDNLEVTNSQNYNLGENQLSRTSTLKWSICCPIFQDNNTIAAIMALDGSSNITIQKDNEGELGNDLVAFSRLLYDSVPQLFER